MSWTLLESQTLSGSQASITLGSGGTLNQGYKTLKVVVSARTTTSSSTDGQFVVLYPNGSSANATNRFLYGTGLYGAGSTTTSTFSAYANPSDYTANTFSNSEFVLPNYSSTSVNKCISSDGTNENNAALASMNLSAQLWSSTSAITSIVITCPQTVATSLVAGTTITLYGLK